MTRHLPLSPPRPEHLAESVGRHHFNCSSGMVLVRGPDVPHANSYGPRGADCLVITVAAECVASDPTLASVFAQPSIHPRAQCNFVTRIDIELSRGDRATPLAVEGLAPELLAHAGRSNEEPKGRIAPKCVRDVRELLEAEYARAIRVSDVAAAVGVHPVYLARAFRAHCGVRAVATWPFAKTREGCAERNLPLAVGDRLREWICLAKPFRDQFPETLGANSFLISNGGAQTAWLERHSL